MAGIPKVKITFDADFGELQKGIKGATSEVETFGSQVAAFGKKAALAFAAVGAAAVAFGVSAAKAAAQDETAQKKLEQTLRATTTATNQQILAVDDWITKQSIATATTDDELRPALSRLVRSVGDVEKSQKLLNLAQEIATATGKPLETVANALAKSFDGQNTALGKLGVGIDAATLKTMTHDQIIAQLGKTYTGFIDNEATNAEFKFKQIGIAVDESKEAIGAALLPVIKELADFLIVSVVPAIQGMVAGLTGDEGVVASLTETQAGAIAFGKKIRSLIDFVIEFKDVLLGLAAVLATVFVVSKIVSFASATIAAIKLIVAAMNVLKNSSIVAGIATKFALNPFLGLAVGAGTIAAVTAAANAVKTTDFQVEARAMGGSVNSGQPYLVGEQGAELFVPRSNGSIVPNKRMGGGVINLTVNGAIDAEGTARTIIDVLNRSQARGTLGSGAFA